MKTLAVFTIVTASAILFFFAVIGALYTYNVSIERSTPEHCPRVVRYEDNSLACVVPMEAEDDDIMILRGV